MANPILTSDIFKDDGAIEAMIGRVDKLDRHLTDLIKNFETSSKKIQTSFDRITLDLNTSKGRAEAQKYASSIEDIDRRQTAVKLSQQKLRQESEKLRLEQQKLNRWTKLLARENTALSGSYDKLSAQYSLNKIRLNEMSDAQRKNTIEGRRLEKQTREIYEEMKNLQSATGKHTLDVGNYNKATQGLVSTLKTLAATYLSLEGARRLGNVIFKQTKEVDALNFAYERIIPNTARYAEVNDFLNGVADRYGVNINKLRKAYLRFTAASASSNLTEEQKMQIFDRLSKSAASLGLEGVKVDRMFNAIEQTMSKGFVSSEELRQQLGDSLPGSLEIMAKALGVTTKELSKMLEQGEVLAEDAIPKFAAQVEKTYGLQTVTKIDNVTSAVGRFETKIIRTITQLDASEAIKNFIDLLGSGVEMIGNNISAVIQLTKFVVAMTAAYVSYNLAKVITNRLSSSSAVLAYREAAAQGILRASVAATTSAFNSLKLALRTNPIGVLLTTIIAGITVWDMFNTKIKESQDYVSDYDRLVKANFSSEKAELNALIEIAKDENATKEQRLNAIKSINNISPEYLGNITEETIKTGEAQKSIDSYTKFLMQKTRMQVAASKASEIQSKIMDIEAEKIGENLNMWEKFVIRIKNFSLNPGVFSLGVGADTEEKSMAKKEAELANLNLQLQQYLKNITDIQEIEKSGTGTGTGTGTGKGKKEKEDPYKLEELRISAMADGFEKELALLNLNYQKRIDLFNKHKLDTEQLLERQKEDRLDLIDKYNDIELDKADEAEKQRIDLLPDGAEKLREKLQFEYEVRLRSAKDKLELEKWYQRELQKINDKENQDLFKQELEAFDQKQALAASEFALAKKNEQEKTKFSKIQALERAKFELALIEKYSILKSDAEIQTIKNVIAALELEIKGLSAGTGGTSKNIFDLLGLNLTDDQESGLRTAFEFAKNQLYEYARLRTQLADQAVQDADREVAAAQRTLDAELNARNAGYANNVETAQKELALARDTQKKALDERRKAQQSELLLQTVEQATNLATAASKVWAQLGFPFAIPAIGVMFGAFAAAKIKSFQLAKRQFGKGDYQVLQGGSHESGNDIPLGTYNGMDNRAEGGEGRAIFNKNVTKKYKKVLPNLVKSVNNGKLEDFIVNFYGKNNKSEAKVLPMIIKNIESKTIERQSMKLNQKGQELRDIIIPPGPSYDINTSIMEGELKSIRRQGEVKEYVDGNGNIVRQYKNLKQTIRKYG